METEPLTKYEYVSGVRSNVKANQALKVKECGLDFSYEKVQTNKR